MLIPFPFLLLPPWQQKGNSAYHGRGTPETELLSMYLPPHTLWLTSFLPRPNFPPPFPILILATLCALIEGQIGEVPYMLMWD